MKTDIHPNYAEMTVKCSCGNVFTTGSTKGGDFNVEQHVHSLDKMAWVMNDVYPARATGIGGRHSGSGARRSGAMRWPSPRPTSRPPGRDSGCSRPHQLSAWPRLGVWLSTSARRARVMAT